MKIKPSIVPDGKYFDLIIEHIEDKHKTKLQCLDLEHAEKLLKQIDKCINACTDHLVLSEPEKKEDWKGKAFRPIVCVDFDGVIHSYVNGWQGVDIINDSPVPGSFRALKEYIKHFSVQIYSSRSKEHKGIHAMIDWFIQHGFEEIDSLSFPVQKPPAWITIDDRAIQFSGKWPSAKEIFEFKPWYKRGKKEDEHI